MHIRIHFLLLVVLLGYSSTSFAQQAGGLAKSAAVATSDAATASVVSDQAASDASVTDSEHPSWVSRDDIYIDDEDDEDDDDEDWEGSGVSTGRGRGGSSGPGSRRGGGGSRNRDDLESSGSGAGPIRNRGRPDEEDEDEDIEQGSGARPDVGVTHRKKPEDKSKKPINPPKEPIEEAKKVPEVGSRPDNGGDFGEEDPHRGTDQEQPAGVPEDDEDTVLMNKPEDRATSFFSQPGILAAVIGGAVVGLLCAILVVMFIVYRMRKKDEGSYALDEPKRSPTVNSYTKNSNREFYA